MRLKNLAAHGGNRCLLDQRAHVDVFLLPGHRALAQVRAEFAARYDRPGSRCCCRRRKAEAAGRAHAHACPLWPSLRRPWSPRGVRGCGGRVQRSPSSSVAVELRPPPRGPVTLPHAGRLIASLIDSPALVGPPSCAQTLPCPEMIPGGKGLCTECGPPGLEHPSQVANWQAHCARAAAGPVPNVGTVTPVEDAGPRPPARRRRQLAARLGARSSNRG